MRVAIFGGTFDPVHQGHMVIAEQVMGELGLDRVVFVPGGVPPHKEASSVRATAEDRYAMVEAAVEANERFSADRVEVDADGGVRTEQTGRDDLLENLLAHRADGRPLLVPLAATGAFMRVLAAVAEAEPVPVDPRAVRWEGEGQDRRPVVADVEQWMERAASTGRTLVELGVPWVHAGRDRAGVRA